MFLRIAAKKGKKAAYVAGARKSLFSAFFRYCIVGSFLNSANYGLIVKKRVIDGFLQCCYNLVIVPKLGTTENYEKSNNIDCFAIRS